MGERNDGEKGAQLHSDAGDDAGRLIAAARSLQSAETLHSHADELERLRALKRATLEATNDAILVTDAHQRIVDFNEQFVRLWQLPSELLTNMQHDAVVHHIASQLIEPQSFLASMQAGAAQACEPLAELRHVDGRVIKRNCKSQLVGERSVGQVWSFLDVTDRKQADSLRHHLAAIVENSDDAIVSKTLEGIIRTWNAGAERTFGYAAHEAVGRSITMLIPTELADEETLILGRVRRGERVEHYETVRLRKDGTPINVSLTVSPVKNAAGEVVGASKIARNITERIQAEEKLRESERELRELAEQREALLQAERVARSDAERASLMKDEFLATLSHELRTPLSAILGWSQVLSSGHHTAADLEQGLDAIQRNARAQTQLIDDLLDMSRIISGKVRLDVQWTDLASVVDAAVDSLRPAAEAKGIRVRKIIDPQAGPVSGDPTRLQQIVWNLLSNSIKFTPKAGKVDVLLERVNSHLEITVHDNGIGIKPEFLPHVFDRFRQADSTSTRSYGGLGLGLSIVKSLVELHGGTIQAKSAGEGQGATFIVCLPLAPVRSSERREHPGTSKANGVDNLQIDLAGLKVLVVDDEPDARLLISRVLTQFHADVRTAASASEGLTQIQDYKPDVLISDIGMPVTDGYEFLRQVRSLRPEEGGRTPAIALTAFARSEDRTRAMLAGYHVHISKPIEPQELVATVGSLAGRVGPAPT